MDGCHKERRATGHGQIAAATVCNSIPQRQVKTLSNNTNTHTHTHTADKKDIDLSAGGHSQPISPISILKHGKGKTISFSIEIERVHAGSTGKING